MNAIRLALAFLRVPRLFAFLFLFPLLLSLLVVYAQLVVTGLFLTATKKSDAQSIKTTLTQRKNDSMVKKLLLGDGGELGDIVVCRWISDLHDPRIEYIPQDCAHEPFDISLRVSQPGSFDPAEYRTLFNGTFRRMHLCSTDSCATEVFIDARPDAERITWTHSVWGLLLLNLAELSPQHIENVVRAREDRDKFKDRVGKLYLKARGFTRPVAVGELWQTLLTIANITCLIIIALWLALKAHRKVLDYFSNSGALLPMVAATGKSTFYCAIWILTFIRVAFFLLGSVPLCYYSLRTLTQIDPTETFFNKDVLAFVLWLLALGMSLSLATLIASIADLKHRHNLMNVAYRYIPLFVAFGGGLVWGLTFLVERDFTHLIRTIISCLPLVGMAPVLLAPVFTPEYGVLVANTLFTMGLFMLAIRSNTRWFAAHLEEL